MRCFCYLIVILFSTWVLQATAEVSVGYQTYPTDQEIATLPPLCKVKLRSDQKSPEFQTMMETYGPDFIHSHHYCTGLNFINRYYGARTLQDKRFDLASAYDNFSYMVAHAKPEFSLMPDVYLHRGLVLSLMSRDVEAIKDLQKALSLNPKTSKAYLTLANIYVKLKQESQALTIVTEGLRQAPRSKALQRRYDELGGKKPYPEPYTPPETKPEMVQEPPKTPDDPMTPAAIRAKRESDVQGSTTSTEVSPVAAPTTTPEPAKIGTSRNPWCRFCAEEDPAPPGQPPSSTPATAPTTAP